MPTTAYLHICIDTEAFPPVVSQVRIMSDGNPTTNFSREMWVTAFPMEGSDYENAQERIIQVLRQAPVMFGWMNPFFDYQLFPDIPPPEYPQYRAPTPEPQSERPPGLPALQRLENITFGDEED